MEWTQSMLFLLDMSGVVNSNSRRNVILYVAWLYVREGFIGDCQHIELHPETYQEPMLLME